MEFYLSILTNCILTEYFVDTKCLVLFSDNKNFDYNGELPIINVLVESSDFDSKLVFQNFGCQGFVVNVESPEAVIGKLEGEINGSPERYNARKYLILPKQNSSDLSIFSSDSVKFIGNILYINFEEVERSNGDEGADDCNNDDSVANIWMKTPNVNFKLYTNNFQNITEPVLLDEWNSQNLLFISNANLYPDKLYDGKGKVLDIATFSYKPYSIPDANDGTELVLAYEFCKKHNLTPHLVIDEAGEWGDIFPNGTGTGILGNLIEDHADIGLAALYSWPSAYEHLDLSKPVIRTGVTCLTPAPTLAPGWLVPVLSFTYDMWVAVGLAFILCSFFLFIFDTYKFFYKNSEPTTTTKLDLLENAIMDTAAVLLQQSVDDSETRDNVKKYMYSCMFIFSLLIASGYSSGLSSSMTVPRFVGAIRTVQELVDSGIQWGATSIAWLISMQEANEYNFLVLLERFVNTDAERLKENNDKRFAFSIERLPAGYFAIGDYITEEGVSHLRLMTEDIYWEQCVLMARKSSIWLPYLDDFILRLAQSGIPSQWEYKIATTHLNARIQRAIKFSSNNAESDDGPKELKWTHVEGAFGIWSFGLAISTIAFKFELFSKLCNFNKVKTVD